LADVRKSSNQKPPIPPQPLQQKPKNAHVTLDLRIEKIHKLNFRGEVKEKCITSARFSQTTFDKVRLAKKDLRP